MDATSPASKRSRYRDTSGKLGLPCLSLSFTRTGLCRTTTATHAYFVLHLSSLTWSVGVGLEPTDTGFTNRCLVHFGIPPAPTLGFEPRTADLTGRNSAVELCWITGHSIHRERHRRTIDSSSSPSLLPTKVMPPMKDLNLRKPRFVAWCSLRTELMSDCTNSGRASRTSGSWGCGDCHTNKYGHRLENSSSSNRWLYPSADSNCDHLGSEPSASANWTRGACVVRDLNR